MYLTKYLYPIFISLLVFNEALAVSFIDEKNDQAIIMVPHRVAGTPQHFRAYVCRPYMASIEKRISLSQIQPIERMDECQEITTKYLPIETEEIKSHYGSRSMPKAWQGKSKSELIDFLNSNGNENLNEEDFKFLHEFMEVHFNRRNSIAKRKVTTFRLRVQERQLGQERFDENRPNTTCTASLIKLENKCHLFTNEHCVQSNPAFLNLDIPELSNTSVEVTEKDVATEWDLMTLNIPENIRQEFCPHLDNINHQALVNHALDPEEAAYSLGYSGRSGQTRLDIFSSQVDQEVFKARDAQRGSVRREVNLEFPGGKAQVYNYLPTYRGMSGGVLTNKDGDPLCLIHRTVPQQDTPQCVDLYELNQFVEGKLPRANPENQLLNPELFQRTYERFDVSENFDASKEDIKRNNQIAPGNSYISPGNTSIPPGNTTIPPGNTSIPPGNTTIPPGNTTIPPGNTYIPPGNTYIPPGNTLIPPGLMSLDFIHNECFNENILKGQPRANFGEFIEALEGIVDHNDREKRELLAVRCGPFSPWEQIDGREDYVHKLERYNLATHSCPDITKLPERDKVYRDQEGFVPLSHRHNLLERLKGTFFTPEDKAAGRYLVYDRLPESGGLMTPSERLAVHHRVTVDPEKEVISISLGGRPGPFMDGSVRTDFKVQYQDEGKTIKLVPQNSSGNFPGNKTFGEMTCENKNFLKLICKGATSAFSLSLNDNGNDRMAVRFSSYDQISRQFIHTHGDLYEDL